MTPARDHNEREEEERARASVSIGRGTATATAALCALLLVLALLNGRDNARSASAQAPDQVEPQPSSIDELLKTEQVVPAGVVYKKAKASVNSAAIEKLSKALLAKDGRIVSDELCDQVLICGPGLWAKIKDDAEVKKITTGKTSFQIPSGDGVQVLAGKLFQNKDEIAAFWQAFARHYPPDPKAFIRRPTADELALYWAMIPYDINEPIFVIERAGCKLLVDLGNADLKLHWIDDYQILRLKGKKVE